MKNYYSIVGVDPNAEQAVIKAACFALSQRYHPDKYSGNPAEAQEKMSEINEARSILCNPKRRAEYDKALQMERVSNSMRRAEKVMDEFSKSNHLKTVPRSQAKLKLLAGFMFWFIIGVFAIKWLAPALFERVIGGLLYSLHELFVLTANVFGMIAVVALVFYILSIPARDRRYKSGYKENRSPSSYLAKTLGYSAIIWFISTLAQSWTESPKTTQVASQPKVEEKSRDLKNNNTNIHTQNRTKQLQDLHGETIPTSPKEVNQDSRDVYPRSLNGADASTPLGISAASGVGGEN